MKEEEDSVFLNSKCGKPSLQEKSEATLNSNAYVYADCKSCLYMLEKDNNPKVQEVRRRKEESLRKRDERREFRRAREHESYGLGDNAGTADLEDIYLVYPRLANHPTLGVENKIHYTSDQLRGEGRRPPSMPLDEWYEVRVEKKVDTYRNLRVTICGVKYGRKNYVARYSGELATCMRCLGSNLCPQPFGSEVARQKMQQKGKHKLG